MFATDRHTSDAGTRISTLTVAICLALAATFIGSLLALGFALYDRSVADARNTAVAVQQYALRSVTTAELAAEAVRDRVLARGGITGIEQDRAMHDLLRDLSARLPEGSGMVVTDADAIVRVGSDQFPAAPVDLSDRDWFAAHRDDGKDFIVSDALTSRVTGRKMFIMTKAIRRQDNSLVGIVNLGVPSDSLIGTQAMPANGSGTVLTLMKPDGGLLARSTFPDDLIGTKLAPVTGTADRATFQASRENDGRMAIEATEVEPRYGLVSRASIPILQVFQPLLILSLIGLPLVIGMMVAITKLIRSLTRQHRRLEQTTARLQVVLDASHLGAWHLHVPTGASEMNERWARIVGHDITDIAQSADEWAKRLHPDEREQVMARLTDVMSGKTALFQMEHRLRHKDGHWVWVLDSGCVVERDAAGNPVTVTGTLLDISERRETERRLHILMGEVDHRSKNLLAVVHSLINLMPADDLARFKKTLLGRIKALGHVHTLLSETGWSGVRLSRLIATETAPYRSVGDADAKPSISISGPDLTLNAAAAQALAMVMHELMTNSAKYGALSAPQGRVAIVWTIADDPSETLTLRLTESGGPPVAAPKQEGFGSRLLSALVGDQLEGTLSQDWAATGAIFTLTAPLHALRQTSPSEAFVAGLSRASASA